MVHVQLHFSGTVVAEAEEEEGKEEREGEGVVVCRAAFPEHGKQAAAIPIIHFYGERVSERRSPSATECVGPPQSSRYQFFILFLSFLASFMTTEACWTQSQPQFFCFFSSSLGRRIDSRVEDERGGGVEKVL